MSDKNRNYPRETLYAHGVPSSDLVLRLLAATVESQKAVAEKLGISPQYLCDVLKGRREISERLAAKLGYRRVVSFIPQNAPHERR